MRCTIPTCPRTVPDDFFSRCDADPSVSFKSVTLDGVSMIYDRGEAFCSHDCWRSVQPEIDYSTVRISTATKSSRFNGLPTLHDDQNIPAWMTDDGAPDTHEVTFGE